MSCAKFAQVEIKEVNPRSEGFLSYKPTPIREPSFIHHGLTSICRLQIRLCAYHAQLTTVDRIAEHGACTMSVSAVGFRRRRSMAVKCAVWPDGLDTYIIADLKGGDNVAIRTRKRGKTYSYIFEAGKDENGKRKVVEKGGYPTKESAYDAGVAAYNDWKHGNIGIISEKISLIEYISHWLDNVAAVNIRQSSLEGYRKALKLWIKPYLQNVLVQEVSPAHIDKWIRELARKGYSRRTIALAKNVVGHALEYAVYPAELIVKNPVHYIKIPKSAPQDTIERKIISVDTFNEIVARYPMGTPYHIPLYLLYYTGIRAGELFGLTWDDIDFHNMTISINRQDITDRETRMRYISPPKTKTSARTIAMSRLLADELEAWHERQQKNEAELDDAYIIIYTNEKHQIVQSSKAIKPDGQCARFNAICTKPDGALLPQASLRYILKSRKINLHSFRHSHITMLIENGANPKSVSARVGHSTVDITQNIYTHVTQKMQAETADIFDKIMQTNSKCRQIADKKDDGS